MDLREAAVRAFEAALTIVFVTFIGAIVLGAAGGMVYLGKELTEQEAGGQPPCDPPKVVPTKRRTRVAPVRRNAEVTEQIRLTPVAGGEPIRIAFREHREPRRARVVFDATAPLRDDLNKLTAAPRGDFVSNEGERFPREQISARPIVSTNGLHVTVRLCLDPRAGRNVEPGTYKGTVLVEGRPRIQPASFSTEVSLRDSRTGFVFLWALIAAIAGVIVKLFVDVVKLLTPPERAPNGGTGPTTITPADVVLATEAALAAVMASPARPTVREEWRTLALEGLRLSNLLSVLVGLVAGVAAYFLLYLDDPDFGSSKDFFKLAVYCFGATVSGMTIADLGKRLPPGIIPAGRRQ